MKAKIDSIETVNIKSNACKFDFSIDSDFLKVFSYFIGESEEDQKGYYDGSRESEEDKRTIKEIQTIFCNGTKDMTLYVYSDRAFCNDLDFIEFRPYKLVPSNIKNADDYEETSIWQYYWIDKCDYSESTNTLRIAFSSTDGYMYLHAE